MIQGRTSRPIDCIERLDGLNFMLFLSYTYRQAPTGVKYYAVIKVVQVGLAYNSVKEERGRGREGREGRERGKGKGRGEGKGKERGGEKGGGEGKGRKGRGGEGKGKGHSTPSKKSGYGPASYIAGMCIPVAAVSTRQSIRSAARGDLLVPRTRVKFGNRAFAVAGPEAYVEQPASRHPVI